MRQDVTSSSKREHHVKRFVAWWLFWGLVVVVGIGLGTWQWQRADDKRAYLAQLEAAPELEAPLSDPPPGARVVLRGEYLAEETYFLDNRVVEGRVGVAVLTPLRGDDGRLWLIQRGFLPTGPSRVEPRVGTPTGKARVSGRWQPANDDALVFGNNREGRRLQSIDLAAWSSLPDFAHEGWVHLEEGAGRLTPWWQPNVVPPSRHLGYAVQWWGLAIAALAVMLVGGRYLCRDEMRRSYTASEEGGSER
ncbi:SURF1-like protein [Litchfieldella qijiaojingensis]|uniref:SURF1-like protein n=1 Tax=Litchfieldella qijiaojingensis TaxID=980347 RepID=A0ABQ2YEM7_9GAMM|nr:SURF1 family protein [Halomonas qijiaojingensis]GGX79667.1 SURF1-like protein [Halomonas qijiaojingensis]